MTLRIERSVEHDLAVFAIMGRIQAEQVPQLLALVKSEAGAHKVVLDLDQVKLADRDAVLFLALSEARGVKLRNCPGFIREWISRERSTRPGGNEGPTE